LNVPLIPLVSIGFDGAREQPRSSHLRPVCPLSAAERMVTDPPPASTADRQALGLAVDHV
jgi:hypothetical protein